jgi:predicted nucleic acid-binding protein
MILVDSSVWIDFFNGKESPEVSLLYNTLGKQEIITGDLIIVEVLQGFSSEKDFGIAKEVLESLPFFNLSNKELAIKSALNYRKLRKSGVTIRKTIDMVIATFCIEKEIKLLHNDRDFDQLEKYLGLQTISLY